MDVSEVAASVQGSGKYKSPRSAQVWFLSRSRGTWKRKYMELKAQAKRMQNRVSDVCKSREKWRENAEHLQEQVAELQAQNARLKGGWGEKRGGADGP